MKSLKKSGSYPGNIIGGGLGVLALMSKTE